MPVALVGPATVVDAAVYATEGCPPDDESRAHDHQWTEFRGRRSYVGEDQDSREMLSTVVCVNGPH